MKKQKALIVYFSYSGTTQNAARQIAKLIDADILRIKLVHDYPDNRPELLKVSKEELVSKNYPPILERLKNLNKYDIVYIGSPNWYSTIAPPIYTFLAQYDYSHKKIIPFITHGGGKEGNCFKDIGTLVPNAKILPGIAIHDSQINVSGKVIRKWLMSIEQL